MESFLKKAEWQTEEQYREALRWLAGLSEIVRRVILECFNPAHRCYRIVGHPGHYAVYSVDQSSASTNTCTVKLVHLDDSTLPEGVGVRGIEPSQVLSCGCRDEEPEPEQQS